MVRSAAAAQGAAGGGVAPMRGRRRRPTLPTFQARAAGEGGAVARAAATWAVDVRVADGWSRAAGQGCGREGGGGDGEA